MAEILKLTLLSPERRLVQSVEVDSVTLPGSEGQIQVLPGHAAMVGTLHTGIFEYQAKAEGLQSGVISTGFFEVHGEEVSVMAETVELKHEIDVVRAKAAQGKAEAELQDPNLDEHKFRKYQLKLQRSLIRQQLGGKSVG